MYKHRKPGQQPDYYTYPQPPAPQVHPREHEKRRGHFRFKPIRTILCAIGLIAVLVALARYVVVPLLVMLPHFIGG